MPHLDPLFQPLNIRHLAIKNRFLSTSHAPGYAVHGNITERYIAYEAEKAKGGVGLVQFGGATAVSVENRSACRSHKARALSKSAAAFSPCHVASNDVTSGANRRTSASG